MIPAHRQALEAAMDALESDATLSQRRAAWNGLRDLLAASPAEAPPSDLVALVREYQAAVNALDCERSAVDHMPDNRFFLRVNAAEAELMAYPLWDPSTPGPMPETDK